MTEEQMLDYFQKEGIPHEQRGGKLFVADATSLPGAYRAYFNDGGFFVDAGKRGKETIKAEGLGTEAVKPGAEADARATAEGDADNDAETTTKRTAAKSAQKSPAKKAGSKK